MKDEPQFFPEIPDIPEEIWEQFRRLRTFEEALTGAFPLAELARKSARPNPQRH